MQSTSQFCIIVWLAKDTALDVAQKLAGGTNLQLASLLFVELFVRTREHFVRQVWDADCTSAKEFLVSIATKMAEESKRFVEMDLAPYILQKVLAYRSVENELMQSHEGRLRDDELAKALGISSLELRGVRELNRRIF
jgi:hypothetical protein